MKSFKDGIRKLGFRNNKLKPAVQIVLPVVSTPCVSALSLFSRLLPNEAVLNIAIIMPGFTLNSLGTQRILGKDS